MKLTKQPFIKSPEETLTTLKKSITKTDMIAFVSGFLLCLMVHFFAYTNTLFVHDSVQLFNDSDGIQNGRFFINILMPLFSRISAPWLIGLFTSMLLGLTNMFIIRTMNIRKTLSIILTGALLSSFPVMAANHIYFSSVYIYVFAMLCATLTVYFADKNIIISGLCLIVSLSCYQAYLTFAISLFIIKILSEIIDDKLNAKQAIIKGLKYIAITIVSVLLYYLLWKGIMLVTNTEVVNYRGYETLGSGLFTNIFEKLLTTIITSWKAMFGNAFHLPWYFNVLFIFINAGALILTLCNIPKNEKCRLISFFIFTLLFFAIALMYFINPTTMHLLMMPAAVIPAILFIKNTENIQFKKINLNNAIKWCSVISLIAVISCFIVTTNITYLKAKTQYDNSISYCTRLIDRLEETDGFNANTKVVFVYDKITYVGLYDIAEWSLGKTYSLPSQGNGAVSYPWTLKIFLREELNIGIDITLDEKGEYIKQDKVKQLEAFPSKNCTTWIDDMLVLKIS